MDNELEQGLEKDSVIEETKESRKKRDCAIAYNCSEDEVALSEYEWKQNPSKFKVLFGDFYLSEEELEDLTSAEGLVLPQNVKGNLYLYDLTSAEGLVLPQSVEGNIDLSSLTSAEGLIFPDELTYEIHMNGFDITPENIDEYRNKGNKRM